MQNPTDDVAADLLRRMEETTVFRPQPPKSILDLESQIREDIYETASEGAFWVPPPDLPEVERYNGLPWTVERALDTSNPLEPYQPAVWQERRERILVYSDWLLEQGDLRGKILPLAFEANQKKIGLSGNTSYLFFSDSLREEILKARVQKRQLLDAQLRSLFLETRTIVLEREIPTAIEFMGYPTTSWMLIGTATGGVQRDRERTGHFLVSILNMLAQTQLGAFCQRLDAPGTWSTHDLYALQGLSETARNSVVELLVDLNLNGPIRTTLNVLLSSFPNLRSLHLDLGFYPAFSGSSASSASAVLEGILEGLKDSDKTVSNLWELGIHFDSQFYFQGGSSPFREFMQCFRRIPFKSLRRLAIRAPTSHPTDWGPLVEASWWENLEHIELSSHNGGSNPSIKRNLELAARRIAKWTEHLEVSWGENRKGS